MFQAYRRRRKENMPNKWHELLHAGSIKWEDLLDPLNPWLLREIIKCGAFAQATYDAFNHDGSSYGDCRYKEHRLFEELNLTEHGYEVTKYIYAISYVGFLRHLKRSLLPSKWSKCSHWIGFVAVSTDDESKRIGRRDIVMVWRGTVALSEWILNFDAKLKHIAGDGDVTVERGFHKIYTTKCESPEYNNQSASEQVMKAVTDLEKKYREKGEKVSFTITGHSLGGALALLNAHEAAASLPDLPITVISFGAPQVGNNRFMEKIDKMKVKTLRIVVEQDIVPKVPPGEFMMTKIVPKLPEEFMFILSKMRKYVYTHGGAELVLDMTSSPRPKPKFCYKDCHKLDTYRHLIDVLRSKVKETKQ